MKDTISISNIKRRLNSPTPPFWKKIRNISMAALAVATTTVALSAAGTIVVPVAILAGAKYIIAISASLGIGSQMTEDK